MGIKNANLRFSSREYYRMSKIDKIVKGSEEKFWSIAGGQLCLNKLVSKVMYGNERTEKKIKDKIKKPSFPMVG